MDIKRLDQEINLMHQQVCSALGDPKRILILYLLDDGPKCVNDLAQAMEIPQSTVSRHLRVLREHRLVRTERQGTTIQYSLAAEQIIQALELLRQINTQQVKENLGLANLAEFQTQLKIKE